MDNKIYNLTEAQKIISEYADEKVNYRTLISHINKGYLKSSHKINYVGRDIRGYTIEDIFNYIGLHKKIGQNKGVIKKNGVKKWKVEA